MGKAILQLLKNSFAILHHQLFAYHCKEEFSFANYKNHTIRYCHFLLGSSLDPTAPVQYRN